MAIIGIGEGTFLRTEHVAAIGPNKVPGATPGGSVITMTSGWQAYSSEAPESLRGRIEEAERPQLGQACNLLEWAADLLHSPRVPGASIAEKVAASHVARSFVARVRGGS